MQGQKGEKGSQVLIFFNLWLFLELFINLSSLISVIPLILKGDKRQLLPSNVNTQSRKKGCEKLINRGYYMAGWRYEIYLWVLKNMCSLVKYFSTREEKFRISKWPCNVLFILFINTNEIPNHFTLIVFDVKGAINYVTIATVIFSQVKITCFFTCEDIMFSRKSSPGISLVFI